MTESSKGLRHFVFPLLVLCSAVVQQVYSSIFPTSSRVTFCPGLIFMMWVFWVFQVFQLYPFYPKYPNYYHISLTIQHILPLCISLLISHSSQFITISHGLSADNFWSITKSPQKSLFRMFLCENQWGYSLNIASGFCGYCGFKDFKNR